MIRNSRAWRKALRHLADWGTHHTWVMQDYHMLHDAVVADTYQRLLHSGQVDMANQFRRHANRALLVEVMKLVGNGVHNDTIRSLLAEVLYHEGEAAAADLVAALPARTTCGLREQWCLTMLKAFLSAELTRLYDLRLLADCPEPAQHTALRVERN